MIDTERLRLRPFVDADIPRVVETCSDQTTRHWLNGMPHPYVEATARGYLNDCVWQAATGAKATWAVADRETDVLLGHVAVMDMLGINATGGEIGYWTHPDARGRGVMTEAVRAVVAHAFDPSGLDRARLTLYAAAGNPASNAVAVAAGFRLFGTQTAAELLGDGTFDDLNGYELLRSGIAVQRGSAPEPPLAEGHVHRERQPERQAERARVRPGRLHPTCAKPVNTPIQIRTVPIPIPTANARIIHRRCCGTLSPLMARKASTRHAEPRPEDDRGHRLAGRPRRAGLRRPGRTHLRPARS